MSEFAIRVENLSRRYQLGASGIRLPYRTLREAIVQTAGVPLRRLRRARQGPAERGDTIWALRDVSFEVRPGEVVGIIGRNGAGKSTLLKILSRITEPTGGRVLLRGRVGSLLEVGTGFHAELTGRENIYLNGVILGLTRREVERQFDAIVEFAGVEQFLDTPVKRYSSGMYVRLAFAVAAHLTSEILIVDEVLAVGDAEFQRKCLGKMQDVAGQGRTVLFVSHNMAVIQTLCRRGVFLDGGRVATDGTVGEAVAAYLEALEGCAAESLKERRDRRGKGGVQLQEVRISLGNDEPCTTLVTGRPCRFTFELSAYRPALACRFTVYNQYGQAVAHFNSTTTGEGDVRDPSPGRTLVCDIDELTLVPGRYRINVLVTAGRDVEDHVEWAALFDVEEGPVRGRALDSGGTYLVCLPHRWKTPALN